MEVLHGLEWQCKPMKLTCLQQQGQGPAVSWKVLASSEVFRFTFWKVVLASNAFIWPFVECRFVVMIPNFKHNGIEKLILLINLIFVLQVLQKCPVNSVTHMKILCEYIYILWIYMYIYRSCVSNLSCWATQQRKYAEDDKTIYELQQFSKSMKLEPKVMRKNISCHPVSKIPGELSRNEALPSHVECDLTQFCLQLVQIPAPPLLVVWPWTSYLTCVNSMLKCLYLDGGVYNGGCLLVHHSKGCCED